ncbi:DEAD/DEAH box helicase [Tessaracoccus sp. OS52]|uniref:DEAD/DEAH box helicase n=1 Tax=Tessaracoccus sp. OS52 TaxID=2886691 RepID=UPI001D12ABD3|nr:DEAD/DEAH box helicase [Tessaracoccus sp. OS52]MCC2593808.1 DEAD/DEAH box helicase [Tessaracoccus sp. OS52]
MTNFPAWVLTPSEADLNRYFGAQTLARGEAYARERRVGSVQAFEKMVTAQVRGSGYHVYRTTVVGEREGAAITTVCTCPVKDACKHGAAVLVHARTALRTQNTPFWQRAFDLVLSDAHQLRDGVRLGLLVDDDGTGPGITPMRWGKTDKWVKTGASWNELRYSAQFDPAQAEALNRLGDIYPTDYYYGRIPARLRLHEFSADVWRALRALGEVGIPLLAAPARGRSDGPTPKLLEGHARAAMTIGKDPAGIVASPTVVVEGRKVPVSARELLGSPTHGIYLRTAEHLLLGPLERPLSDVEESLFMAGQVRIPAKDAALFATGYLPRLRSRFEVDVEPGVVLPEPLPPRLRLQVTFDGHSAALAWGFRYQLEDQTLDVGLRTGAGDPPLRDPEAEAALVESLPAGPWLTTHYTGRSHLHDAELRGMWLITFTTEVLPELVARDDVDVELNEAAPEFRRAEEAPTISLNVEESREGDWFDLQVEVSVGEEKVPFAPLLSALAAGQDHIILPTGTWFSLQVPELDRLRQLVEEARVLVDHEGDTFQLRPEHAGLWQELVELGVVGEQSAAWRDAVGALLDHSELPDDEPPAGLRATLRPYQREGYAWLKFLWRTRLGGILADEMGLGKTLQSLAMAQAALEAGQLDRPVLVVAPTSVIGTWASEAARFAPELRVVAITETGRRRGEPLADVVAGAHVVLTSYTLLRLEDEDYLGLEWSAVLLDEAQFVKNPAAKVHHAVRKLRARMKVALTGTPLENNLMDLWALLSITAPGLFADPKAFTEVFRKPIEGGDADALAKLHRRIRPLILRRTKAAVAKELPEKQEQVVSVPLGPVHRKLYDRHLTRERQKVLGLVGDLGRNRITILRSLTLLRQLSLAPSLVDDEYPATSAKIDALLEHLQELRAAGHRALVFSQFTSFLTLVRHRLNEAGIAFEYLDGRTRDRAKRIDDFRTGDAPVFLISLKAGGFGLTLTEADYVFILDPWWNPAAESQAIDRTHRIGQDKHVNVYRLVSADTIEEKVVALQARKRDLFDAVVARTSDLAAPLSADDIRGLLDA